MSDRPRWTLDELHTHFQFAVDLEFYTIPYYISAMYSVVDPSDPAYQLIQSVVYQEMLHLQLAANAANAYAAEVVVTPPDYGGRLPHLNFSTDPGQPIHRFSPFSTDIGPLDQRRLNTMCLIEYPRYGRPEKAELRPKVTDYDSIGHFYDAVQIGAHELRHEIIGGRNQVDAFGRYYADMSGQTVTADGADGWAEVRELFRAIVTQGEGQHGAHTEIPTQYRNTADDPAAVLDHYDKFVSVRERGGLPEVYAAESTDTPGPEQRRLIDNFELFCEGLTNVFQGRSFETGRDKSSFEVLMAKLGSNILTCWRAGVTPMFTDPTAGEETSS